jgi:hypothetical protein
VSNFLKAHQMTTAAMATAEEGLITDLSLPGCGKTLILEVCREGPHISFPVPSGFCIVWDRRFS